MAANAVQQAPVDRLAWIHLIRDVFARSPLFREVTVSQSRRAPAGVVVLGLSFDRGPSLLQVAADAEEKAYAILLKLAEAMVDVERWPRAEFGGSCGAEAQPVAEACGVRGFTGRPR